MTEKKEEKKLEEKHEEGPKRLDAVYGRALYETESSKEEDIELEIIDSEDEDYESAPPEYLINTYPADYTLDLLHSKWKNGDIEIPPFQRQFVWKQAQASKLIESFLHGLPVPAVFLYTDRKSQKYLVIDGQQRLKTVFYFFEGYFGEAEKEKRRIFKLTGLSEKSKFSENTFSDLDEVDQRRLNNCVLRCFIVQQLDPEDDTSLYHIFERLNTGGTLLTNQEVRNCVYRGLLSDTLAEMNRLDSWRAVIGKPNSDSRQRDVELILRYLALHDVAEYEKPMKEFLSKYMSKHRNPSKQILSEINKKFKVTCDAAISYIGEKPFHGKAGINAAVFDSVMVALSKNIHQIPQDIKKRYQKLLQTKVFVETTKAHTTDVRVVQKRFELAEHTLF